MMRPEVDGVGVGTTQLQPIGHTGSAPLYPSGRVVVSAWFVSVALHIVGLVLMFLFAFPYAPRQQAAERVVQAELIDHFEGTAYSPSPLPELADQPTSKDPLKTRFTPKEFDSLSEMKVARKPELSILGIGAGGGDFSHYGLTAGSGGGPKFFGLGGSARGVRRIVYVVDRSGSMLDTFQYVRQELKRSISALRRTQKFHVIFFSSGMVENTPKRLVSSI